MELDVEKIKKWQEIREETKDTKQNKNTKMRNKKKNVRKSLDTNTKPDIIMESKIRDTKRSGDMEK